MVVDADEVMYEGVDVGGCRWARGCICGYVEVGVGVDMGGWSVLMLKYLCICLGMWVYNMENIWFLWLEIGFLLLAFAGLGM